MLSSQLNETSSNRQLQVGKALLMEGEDMDRQTRSPSKARSLSDVPAPSLSPSPKFREPQKRRSKDDSTIAESPTTPRRPAFPMRGLSLQMPARELMSPSSSSMSRVPLSPKLDHSQTYGSPTSVLPRRSRGLDFSRAATNLHHSTLAEQSSPDSSPTIGGRAMNIPNRKNGLHFTLPDSNNPNTGSLWSTMASADRMNVSNSLGSINMMDSSSGSSDEEDMMDADDIDDSILTTPQTSKMSGPFGVMPQPSPGNQWSSQSPAVSSLINFQRARLRHKGRKSSSSGSTNSMASPSSKSPPIARNLDNINGYFGKEEGMSRRESISWAANQLHISGSESDDGTLKSKLENADPITPGREQRGVIRRAVTRRGNMLPKTKGFARIRAALAEESAPVETEVRREAEVVRQTRESDMDLEPRHPSTSTAHSSPNLGPTHDLEGIPEDDLMSDTTPAMSSSFKQHAMKNSKGKEFWDTFTDDRNRTPPPGFLPRGSSSVSDEISLDSTPPSSLVLPEQQSQTGPTAAEITQKMNKKRRRDDDFDPSSFKRRAVSPGMSVHNSPVMQSPMQRDVAPWGSRPPSTGEGKANPPKRVGYQGMVDTNDGLMKMSIE
ncbi:hypothetical protein PVAG01_05791 [Phlyctema vagabunda]|uniref:Uncharacterized protein n=1 Tax=Phlyctema vagabunda TaxID=108571 RepID=A0ABR4PE84_9HELO